MAIQITATSYFKSTKKAPAPRAGADSEQI